MKEKPILFSAPMVRALLADAKTMTRRIVKFPVTDRYGTGCEIAGCELNSCLEQGLDIAPYRKRQILWVKETFQAVRERKDGQRYCTQPVQWLVERGDCFIEYAATPRDSEPPPKWRPSIFMPRWASRITLEVTNVRVERLGDISCDDIRKEGITVGGTKWDHPDIKGEEGYQRALRGAWVDLWTSIHEKYDANVWVWVIEFKRLK